MSREVAVVNGLQAGSGRIGAWIIGVQINPDGRSAASQPVHQGKSSPRTESGIFAEVQVEAALSRYVSLFKKNSQQSADEA